MVTLVEILTQIARLTNFSPDQVKKIECISFVLRNRPKLAMDFTSFRTAGFAKHLQLTERENRFSEPTLST